MQATSIKINHHIDTRVITTDDELQERIAHALDLLQVEVRLPFLSFRSLRNAESDQDPN